MDIVADHAVYIFNTGQASRTGEDYKMGQNGKKLEEILPRREGELNIEFNQVYDCVYQCRAKLMYLVKFCVPI